MSQLASLLTLERPLIMGVLNVTPDSFSDGGDFFQHEFAISRVREMIEEGADIIDIGGESTRPPGSAYGEGAQPVQAHEEIRRVFPVIEAIRKEGFAVPISIDTVKSETARLALLAGANIINDVSGGTADPRMFSTASELHAPMILMHGHGPLFTKAHIEEYEYEDVVASVMSFLRVQVRAARLAGVETVMADVGIGFAKTYKDNLRLLSDHSAFLELGVPMVLGVSRKSTIGRAMVSGFGEEEQAEAGSQRLPAPRQRVTGSIAAACYGVEHGAKIIRAHDVAATREALSVFNAILTTRHEVVS